MYNEHAIVGFIIVMYLFALHYKVIKSLTLM